MTILSSHLVLPRCPHCQIDNPNLHSILYLGASNTTYLHTVDHQNIVNWVWKVYKCARCGGVILAGAVIPVVTNYVAHHVSHNQILATEIYPTPIQVDENLPDIAKEYLIQAINSVHSPAGSVMLCASSVDAMLKDKGYTNGSLYARINKAADEHLITEGMKS